jgi:hypothetical protein
MKMLEKVGEGAGIAMNYVVGAGAIWFGAGWTAFSLLLWTVLAYFQVEGIALPLAISTALLGVTPIGVGTWLFRRGRIQQQLFKVKLLKETVRKLAFERQGRLRPAELAHAKNFSEERALNVLKNLAAEDPDQVELQLDYDSGELYFEFPGILRSLEARRAYQALPESDTLDKKAVDLARVLGKTVETFYDYVKCTQSNDRRQREKGDKYKAKLNEFVREIEALKNQ